MKNRHFLSVLLCLLALPMVSKAQAYVSISELNEQPPARWTQTYETQWRTVEIDVQPRVPQVEKIPIVKVAIDYWHPDVSSLGEEWISESHEEHAGAFVVAQNNVFQYENKKTTSTGFSVSFDMSKKYGKNTSLTLGDVLNRLKEIMTQLESSSDNWDYEHPTEFYVNETLDEKTGEPLFPDIYTVFIVQKIEDIPLLGHVLSGIEQPDHKESYITTGNLMMRMCMPDVFSISGWRAKVTTVLSQDLPLCDFSKVKGAIENEIEAGHVRKIFDVELGYALYNEPGSFGSTGTEYLKSAQFYAIPVWWVNCYYVEHSKTELREYSNLDVSERNTHEYKTLIVNAQTGEVMNRSNNHSGCGDYQGFISWEDVGGQ